MGLSQGGPKDAVPASLREITAPNSVSRKLERHADSAPQVAGYLLEELVRRGLADPEGVAATAGRLAAEAGRQDPESLRWALIFHLASLHLEPAVIEEYLNLARKRKRVLALKLALSHDGTPAKDVWRALERFCELPLGEKRIAPSELLSIRAALIERFISGHLSYIGVAKHHLTIRGICGLAPSLIGTGEAYGRIGGKSAGLLLAMAILKPSLDPADPRLAAGVDMPKSYFVRSDILQAWVEHNLTTLEPFMHQKYKDVDEIQSQYPAICQLGHCAEFPPSVAERFRAMLEEIGPRPIIVRSSSYLEDNSGFAFSGKYESVFLPNQGDPDQRMAAFQDAVRRVYTSTLSPDAIIYRRERGLLDYNEQMCLLVQEVVGGRRGDYFFPMAAGVATSTNNYAWSPRIKRTDGFVRMVMGLGTRAVERMGEDHARLVGLTEPRLRPEIGPQQIMRYSQRKVHVLNLATGQEETIPAAQALELLDGQELGLSASVERGGVLDRPLGRWRPEDGRACLTFDGLLGSTDFAPLLREVLARLSRAMGRPVEIEFAYQDGKLYLLQCRSLASPAQVGQVEVPDNLPPEAVLFESGQAYTSAVVTDVDFIIYVDPAAYLELEGWEPRLAVGRLVGFLNRRLKDRSFIMMGPGRWGTNNPELGVKVGYGDICFTRVLVELSWGGDKNRPEASYGTHFFHDLVENNILALPVFSEEPGSSLNREFFARDPEPPSEWRQEFGDLAGCVKLFDLPALCQGRKLQVLVDGDQGHALGFLRAA